MVTQGGVGLIKVDHVNFRSPSARPKIHFPALPFPVLPVPSLPLHVGRKQKSVGKKKSVTIALQLEKKNYIICEFFDNGNLSIKCSFEDTKDAFVTTEKTEDILKQHINPILNIIGQFF